MALIGNTIRFEAEFETFDGVLTSPDDVKIKIYDGGRTVILEDDVTPYETGKYRYDYTIPEAHPDPLYVEFSGLLEGNPVAYRETIGRKWSE